jgi:hypothetical protein
VSSRRAEIDLSGQVGKTVTVQFLTEDCALGGHYGYAYVDNFCGLCDDPSSGSIKFAQAASTNCGPGKLCFDYTLRTAGNQTGTIQATLAIYGHKRCPWCRIASTASVRIFATSHNARWT